MIKIGVGQVLTIIGVVGGLALDIIGKKADSIQRDKDKSELKAEIIKELTSKND